MGNEGGHKLLVDLACKDHFHCLHGSVVRDAQSLLEMAFDVQALQHGGNLRATAVDNHALSAFLGKRRQIHGKGVAQGRVGHGMTAEFDDNVLCIRSFCDHRNVLLNPQFVSGC